SQPQSPRIDKTHPDPCPKIKPIATRRPHPRLLVMTQDFFVNSGSFISLVSVIALTILSQSRRGKKRILITDYRRGVRFVGGVFSGVLEPGSYLFDARKEQITIMDMRPQPILLERLTFQDALKQQGVVSLATEFVVRDPQLAATALRDQIKDCYLLARNAIRT